MVKLGLFVLGLSGTTHRPNGGGIQVVSAVVVVVIVDVVVVLSANRICKCD